MLEATYAPCLLDLGDSSSHYRGSRRSRSGLFCRAMARPGPPARRDRSFTRTPCRFPRRSTDRRLRFRSRGATPARTGFQILAPPPFRDGALELLSNTDAPLAIVRILYRFPLSGQTALGPPPRAEPAQARSSAIASPPDARRQDASGSACLSPGGFIEAGLCHLPRRGSTSTHPIRGRFSSSVRFSTPPSRSSACQPSSARCGARLLLGRPDVEVACSLGNLHCFNWPVADPSPCGGARSMVESDVERKPDS